MLLENTDNVLPVRVKICGITCLEDAVHAVNCGADALGFVFYPPSPRFIDPVKAQKIIAALPPFISRVGLFVNAQPAAITEIVEQCCLDVVQLHGDEPPAACRISGVKVIKALRLRDAQCLEGLAHYPVAALLLDAWVSGSYGGTGQLARWDLAAQLAQQFPVILAGGLTPTNVAAAIEAVHPFAVDVSSGVENAPGCKDPQQVRSFIHHAKNSWR